jgi:hypothetical protein
MEETYFLNENVATISPLPLLPLFVWSFAASGDISKLTTAE